MRTVVHLSDIHFGAIHRPALEPLLAAVREAAPHVIAVSGDLTQRARESEFIEARAFLDSLPAPVVVVPGNHDVPLYNVWARFAWKLTAYKRHITPDLAPVYADPEIAVLGVNTARSSVWKGGRINNAQVEEIRRHLGRYGNEVTKIVVTHHPFDVPNPLSTAGLVGRARMAMERWAHCGADIFLAGHLHVTHTGMAAQRYGLAGMNAIIVQAGTAASFRGRGEANAFNVLAIGRPQLRIRQFLWDSGSSRFLPAREQRFLHTGKGWAEERAAS